MLYFSMYIYYTSHCKVPNVQQDFPKDLAGEAAEEPNRPVTPSTTSGGEDVKHQTIRRRGFGGGVCGVL